MVSSVYRPHPAMCADGKVRTAHVRSYWDGAKWCLHADTYFSIPARVRVRGKTVTGFVTLRDVRSKEPPEKIELEFSATLGKRNAALLRPARQSAA